MPKQLLLVVAFALGAIVLKPASIATESPVYELRIYHTHEGKLEALHKRFVDHTMRLFEKHGMTNVGYWTAANGDANTLTFLLSYPDFQGRERAWKAFTEDPEWQAAYAASHLDGPLVRQVDSRLLRVTDYSPSLSADSSADGERLFELRVYTAEAGRLDHLDARFREHTLSLFAKHGMEPLIYFHVAEGAPGADETLLYFLAHADEAARDASFDAFRKDPEWVAARAASEERAGGSLTAPEGVKSYLLRPTAYSPLR